MRNLVVGLISLMAFAHSDIGIGRLPRLLLISAISSQSVRLPKKFGDAE